MVRIDHAAVEVVQATLRAPKVAVFVVGRQELSARRSLAFVADQARELGRAGFAFGEEAERYVVKGGLAEAELDGVFRAAAGRRAELAVQSSVIQWANGRAVGQDALLPPLVKKELSVPASVAGLTKIAAALRTGVVRSFGEASGGRAVRAEVGGRRV